MDIIQQTRDIFYEYMVKGIIDSNIREDGGLECYQ